MKGYFIPFGSRKIVSIDKKIDMQIQQLTTIASIEEVDVEITPRNFFRNVSSVLPYVDLPWDYTDVYQKIQDPDFIFMRRTGADRSLINFLKYIKKKFPQCKIIIEIPTYPYMKESLQRIDGCVLLPKDLYNRKKLKRYVDRILTYSEDDRIFDIPTIRTINGISMKDVKPVHKVDKDDKIILLAVAVFRPAHGYERCLQGLADYYNNGGKRLIEIHMVGYGKEVPYYRKLVKKNHLEKYVFFHGKKTGDELDHIYSIADIALGYFGGYKVKTYSISTLKTNEYLAKGLPIISGCNERVFEGIDVDFYEQFPNDSTPVSMEEVIHFYDKLYKSGEKRQDIETRIRDFASRTVDIEITMKPVIEYLKHLSDLNIP